MSYISEVNGSLNLSSSDSAPKEDCDFLLDSLLVKVIKTIAYSMLLILSLAGNSLVIAVIYRNHKLRTIINLLILNMAASDLLIPLFALPLRIERIYFPRELWLVGGIFGSVTCKFIPFAEKLSTTVSVLTLELISIQKFFSIFFPMKRLPIHSKKACYILIVLTWLIGAIYPSMYFYTYKIIYRKTIPYCTVGWEPAFNNAEAIKIQFPIFLVFFTMIPFILLTSLYSAIIVSLHRQKASLHMATEAIQRRLKENRRVTYMLLTIVIVFLVSWTPVNIYLFLCAFIWDTRRPCDSRHLIFSCVYLGNIYPAVNPLIYYIFIGNYRKGLKELMYCLKRSILTGENRCSQTKYTNRERASTNTLILLNTRIQDDRVR